VLLHYWLRDKADSVTVSILDAHGNEVRSFASKRDQEAAPTPPTEGEVQQVTGEEEVAEEQLESTVAPWAPSEAGMNRLVWDFRYERPTRLEKKSRSSREEALEGTTGPRAVPAEYQARLSIGDQTLTQSFRVLADPRLSVSAEALKAQFELKLAIRDRISETHTAINQVRRIREQVEEWEKRSGERAPVKEAVRALKDQLKAVEGELINLDFEKPRPGLNRIKEKWDALASMIDESDDAPTRGAQDFYAVLREQLEEQRKKLTELVEGPVKSFSELVQHEGVPAIAP
jgi:hypothetical protein